MHAVVCGKQKRVASEKASRCIKCACVSGHQRLLVVFCDRGPVTGNGQSRPHAAQG
jgi:hypothetical protein